MSTRKLFLTSISLFLFLFIFFSNIHSTLAANLYWFNSSVLSSQTTDNGPTAMATDGQKIFVANKLAGKITVYSTYSTQNGIQRLATISIGNDPNWIAYANGRIYVTTYSGKLCIYDTTTYSELVSTSTTGHSVTVTTSSDGQYVYVGNTDPYNNVQVYNYSSGGNTLTLIGTISSGIPYVNSVATDDTYLYLTSEPPYAGGVNTQKMLIYDISAHSNPVFVSSSDTNVGPTTVTVQGNYVYVANIDGDTVQVFDVTNKASPVVVGSVAMTFANVVYVSGNYIYVTGNNFIKKYDISAHTNPVLAGSISLSDAISVVVSGSYVYGLSYTGKLIKTYNLSDLSEVADQNTDSNWTTLSGNWWNDSSHTSQASGIPTLTTDAILLGPVAPTTNLGSPSYVSPNSIDSTGLYSAASSTGIIFAGSGTFSSTVTGPATFTNSTVNNGTINGSATFLGDLSENTGTVSGTKTRKYTSDISISRNFVATGPWTVLADGAVVNRFSATYNSSTTFQTANGGSFSDSAPPLYWYNAGANTNWNTLTGNWWNDAAHTSQSSHLPFSTTSVAILIGPTSPVVNLDSAWVSPLIINSTELTGTSTDSGVQFTSTAPAEACTSITGNATFNGYVANVSVVNGNATFKDHTSNAETHSCTFGGTGDVEGNASFYDYSTLNSPTRVSGDATFFGDLSEIAGGSAGNLIREYTSDIILTRDFTSGNWKIVANGAIVNILNINYNGGTTFEAINGGVFAPIEATIGSPTTSSITQTSATLSATITNDGYASSTDKGFEYGRTASYGSTTASTTSFGSGTFSLSISNLTCNTTYHYRGYVTNVIATSNTNDATFTTSACPAPPSPPSVVTVGGSSGWFGTSGSYSPVTSVVVPVTNPPSPSSTTTSVFIGQPVIKISSFTRNLSSGSNNIEVKTLQQYLNSNNYPIAKSGPGSPGNESSYFGNLTKAALIKFQKDHGIKPASGIFGPITRNYILKSLKLK